MWHEVVADVMMPGAWRVEAINHAGAGEVFITIFAGTGAEWRARAFARAHNEQVLPAERRN